MVVFDEAQKLLDIMRNERILKHIRNWFYFEIRKAHKLLLLSGTPLYYRPMDLSLFVNLCASSEGDIKPVIPFSERQFHKLYFKRIFWKSALYGWLVPLLNNNYVKLGMLMFTGGLMTVQLINYLHFFSNPVWSGKTEELIIAGGYDKRDADGQEYPENSSMYDTDKLRALRKKGTIASILHTFASAVGYGESFRKGKGVSLVAVWAVPIFTSAVLCSVLGKLAKYNLDNIHELDTQALSKDIGDYMSFHTFRAPSVSTKYSFRRKFVMRNRSIGAENNYHYASQMRKYYPREFHNKRITYYGKQAVVTNVTYDRFRRTFRYELHFDDGTESKVVDLSNKESFTIEPDDFETREHFKKEHVHFHEVSYSRLQYNLFLDVTTGVVSSADMRYFTAEDPTKPATSPASDIVMPYSIFDDDLFEEDEFLKQGRVIGNLTLPTTEGVLAQKKPSISKALNKLGVSGNAEDKMSVPDNDGRHSTRGLTGGGTTETVPPKFVEMLKAIRAAKHESDYAYAVVYSSFIEYGLHAFYKYIRMVEQKAVNADAVGATEEAKEAQPSPLLCRFYKSTRHRHLGPVDWHRNEHDTPDGEEPKQYDILFIDPDMTEGINLHNSRSLHVMEPLLNPNAFDQLKARINRYDKTGYKTTTDVHIHVYVSSVKGYLQRLLLKMKHWCSKTDKGRIFWKRYTVFDQDCTPDAIVQQKADELRHTIEQLSKQLMTTCKVNHTMVQYSKRTHKNYVVEDMSARYECPICRPSKRSSITGSSSGTTRKSTHARALPRPSTHSRRTSKSLA